MKRNLLAGVAAAAFIAAPAFADGHLMFAPGGEDRFSWDAYEAYKADAPDLSGETVTIAGPWLGEERDRVVAAFAYFSDATGATVEYAGSDSFEQQIVIDAEAGSAPNLAVFPQPGLLRVMAERGLVEPLSGDDASWIADNYAAGQSWVDLASFEVDGESALYGMFYRVDLKSLVWFVPENFEDAGYEIPGTMEELKELTDQIVADGGTPWCIGLGSGGATGWPATDWVEDMMLRTQEPSVYDAWVSNEMPFDAPEVIAAIEEFGYFARNDDYVAGGAAAVATTDFRDSPQGLFSFPPECYMHRQASFIPAFFPEGTELGTDADFFYFPAYEGKDLGSPVLGAGTVMGITNDSEATRAFIEFMKQPIAHEAWMAQGAFLTAHAGVNQDAYFDDALRAQGQIIQDATTFRFDASDLMPGAIGAGAFWTGMVDYAGGASAEDVAGAIQETWESLE